MDNKKLGKKNSKKTIKNKKNNNITYPRPSWVPKNVLREEELCPDCFKVVGERSRYSLVCILGRAKEGMTVTNLTERMSLKQPTVTHHLKALLSVDAVKSVQKGREKFFIINRDAHCFEECKIPY